MKKQLTLYLSLVLCASLALAPGCSSHGTDAPALAPDVAAPAEGAPAEGTPAGGAPAEGAPSNEAGTPAQGSEPAGTAPNQDGAAPPGATGVIEEPGQGQAAPSMRPTATAAPPDQEQEAQGTQGAGEKPGGVATPEPPNPDEGPVVLTIRGDGVSGETTWTLGQLQALRDGYRESTFSTTNNWPTFGHMQAKGVSLPYLLGQAGLLGAAASFRLVATDGYHITATYGDVFDPLRSYSAHSPEGSSRPSVVIPIIAWEWGERAVRPESLRPFFGQRGPYDVNTASFVKGLCIIEVSTTTTGAWGAPGASIAGGSAVPYATELELTHGSADNVRIYYTLDGSEPDYDSQVYNRSASYFQPHLVKPIALTQDMTIKAFAAGFGKDPSPVAEFSYTVE